MNTLRSRLLPPLLVLVLTVAAVAAVWLLIQRADSSRGEQLRVAAMTLQVAELQSDPFNAEPSAGGSPSAIRVKIEKDQDAVATGLTVRYQQTASPALLASGRDQLATIEPVVANIYRIAVTPGGLSSDGAHTASLQKLLTIRSKQLSRTLAMIGRQDATAATQARSQAKLGATATMLLLLLGFSYFYFGAINAREALKRVAQKNESLLGVSRVEARTDALTGLGNRRALIRDLTTATANPTGSRELLLAMYDLDGFKQYNDSFGHAAGDALLRRLGKRLAGATGLLGNAYRLGGDEFCTLVRCSSDAAEKMLNDAVGALQDSRDGRIIRCSYGAVWIPVEAATESQALQLADERMYANKQRSTAEGAAR